MRSDFLREHYPYELQHEFAEVELEVSITYVQLQVVNIELVHIFVVVVLQNPVVEIVGVC